MVGANSCEESMEAVSEPWTEQRAKGSFSRFHREPARYSGIGLSPSDYGEAGTELRAEISLNLGGNTD